MVCLHSKENLEVDGFTSAMMTWKVTTDLFGAKHVGAQRMQQPCGPARSCNGCAALLGFEVDEDAEEAGGLMVGMLVP